MIEFDVYDYLNNDAALSVLLNDTGGNIKVFPIRAEQGTIYPYVVYEISSYGNSGYSPYVNKDRITFKIICSKYSDGRPIRERMRKLLDLKDKIVITSTNYRIEWAELITGQDMEDEVNDPDTEQPAIIIVNIYEFSFIDRD